MQVGQLQLQAARSFIDADQDDLHRVGQLEAPLARRPGEAMSRRIVEIEIIIERSNWNQPIDEKLTELNKEAKPFDPSDATGETLADSLC